MQPSEVTEVQAFLASIGREDCVNAVVQQGFYTSMAALRGATYEELVECGVRAAHAKQIVSSLGSGAPRSFAPLASAPAEEELDEVAAFLRSVGLENCARTIQDAGFANLDQLGEASMQELLAAGLKPVHCRLIISNLDTASSAAITLTPVARRIASLEENSLLGGDAKRKRPSAMRKYGGPLAVLALLVLALVLVLFGGSAAPRPAKGAPEGGSNRRRRAPPPPSLPKHHRPASFGEGEPRPKHGGGDAKLHAGQPMHEAAGKALHDGKHEGKVHKHEPIEN